MKKNIVFSLVLSFFAVFWSPVIATELNIEKELFLDKKVVNQVFDLSFLDTNSLPLFQNMSARILAVEDPPEPLKADMLSFLKGFGGHSEVNLFSGSLGYEYPIILPPGRGIITPNLALNYSSQNRDFSSIVGHGWSLSIDNIHLFSEKGVDKTYTENNFFAEINGQITELISLDSATGRYGAKVESGFSQFVFNNNQWVMTDTAGTKYFFGTDAESRQENPANSGEIYKWMVERVEDMQGNFMTVTYTKHNGQIYPDTIRYTGQGADLGIYEIRFVLSPRPAYTEYKRGFGVTTDKVISAIQVFSRASGNPELVYEYDLEHNFINNAVSHLTKITQKKGSNSLPSTEFSYYDGSEPEDNKKIHLLKKITYPLGGEERFTYKPDTAYKIGNTQANPIPFIVHVLDTENKRASSSDPWDKTIYDYRGGHYYYDHTDAYKKEYAGFHQVTKTDPLGNVAKFYFHQSEFAPDNTNSSLQGEYQDHISKKGRIYRQEMYDNAHNLYQLTITQWNKELLSDDDPEGERYFVSKLRQISTDYDGDSSVRTKALEYAYDDWGNIIEEKNYGEVSLDADDGSFTDLGDDRVNTITSYAQNPVNYLYSYPKQVVRQNVNGDTLSKIKYFYDNQPYGEITQGLATRTENNIDAIDIAVVENSYNDVGLLTSTKNPRNLTTTFTYDTHKLYPEAVTNPKGYITTSTYDYRFGVPKTITDPNALVTETTYDDFGRLVETKQSDPNNPANLLMQSTVQYDLTATPPKVTQVAYTQNNGIDQRTATYLDGLGRKSQVRSEAEGAEYRVVNFWYDELDRVSGESLPVLQVGENFVGFTGSELQTAFIYDAVGRQKTVTTPLGTTNYTYNDWKTTITDAKNNQKDLHYDAWGNLVGVTEYLNSAPYETVYEYDLNQHLTKITDALGNEKNMTYDWLGRQKSREKLHVPGATVYQWEYTYDKNDNVIFVTDPKGQTTTNTYDELDRVITVDSDVTSGTEFAYTYDTATNGIGKLTKVEGVTDTEFAYDILGRVTTEKKTIDGNVYMTNFSRDFLGNPLNVTYPNTTVVNYTYDNAGAITSVATPTKTIISDVDYGPTGAITQIAYGNGAVTTNTFDINQNYFLTNKLTVSNSQNVQNIVYSFDDVGNITQITDTSATNAAKVANYDYDDLYRLTSATITDSANADDYARTYSYDITGNILTKSDLAGTYQYTGGHPQAVSSAGGKTFVYDLNGNMTSNGQWTQTWNWQDRMTQSLNSAVNEHIEYRYDHTGQRVVKNDVENEKKTIYVNKYFDQEGGEDKVFIYLGNKKVATFADNEYIYHHEDHLTGTSVDTDESGAVNQLNDYYPYGEQRLEEVNGSYENDYNYTGKELDDETGLHYYEARYYDANIARFTAIDSWAGDLTDPQSLNKYAYVRNNPLKYVDPSGNFYQLPVLFGVALVIDVIDQLDNPQTAHAPATTNIVEKQKPQGGVLIGPGSFGKAKNVNMNAVKNKISQTVDKISTKVRNIVTKNTRRGKYNIQPNHDATGPHTVFKIRDGEISNYKTFSPNPKNPTGFDQIKKVNINSRPHTNSLTNTPINAPNVQSKNIPGGVRPANQSEIPKPRRRPSDSNTSSN